MKKILQTGVLASCLMVLAFAAYAANGDNAPKGWLLVRSGAAKTNANYDKEDQDANGRLSGVSVLCQDISETPANIQRLIATDTSRGWGGTYFVARASTVINLGGNVVIDALPGNPNHCLINGLTLSQIKGIWH